MVSNYQSRGNVHMGKTNLQKKKCIDIDSSSV